MLQWNGNVVFSRLFPFLNVYLKLQFLTSYKISGQNLYSSSSSSLSNGKLIQTNNLNVHNSGPNIKSDVTKTRNEELEKEVGG